VAGAQDAGRTLVLGDPVVVLGSQTLIPDGGLVVEGNTITAAGARADLERQGPFDRVLGSPSHFVLPGFINCHYHSELAIGPGLYQFIFERAKKDREAKKAQTKIEVKEIRLRPKTNEAHRGFKVDDARRWLLQGNKVRVTIKFRGREMDYPEIALEDLKEIAAALSDVSTVEQSPQMEGRTMLVVLAPSKGIPKKKEKSEQPKADAKAEAIK